jgi:hypothetical protein
MGIGYWRSVPHKARILSVHLQIVTVPTVQLCIFILYSCLILGFGVIFNGYTRDKNS